MGNIINHLTQLRSAVEALPSPSVLFPRAVTYSKKLNWQTAVIGTIALAVLLFVLKRIYERYKEHSRQFCNFTHFPILTHVPAPEKKSPSGSSSPQPPAAPTTPTTSIPQTSVITTTLTATTTTTTTTSTTTATATPVASTTTLAPAINQLDGTLAVPNGTVLIEMPLDEPQEVPDEPKIEEPEVGGLVDSFIFVKPSEGFYVPRLATYHHHKGKWMAYRHYLDELFKLAGKPPELPVSPLEVKSKPSFWNWTGLASPSVSPQEMAWNALMSSMKYHPLEKVEDQYYNFVIALRSACDTFKDPKDPRTAWITNLAYHRFHSISLSSYCEQFILQNLPDYKFPDLNLGNFFEELNKINNSLKQSVAYLSITEAQRIKIKLEGQTNINFDPLAKTNIPYRDGELKLNGKPVGILRHGVQVYHNASNSNASQSLDGALDYIRAFVSVPKIGLFITSDYERFINANPKHNILHNILENIQSMFENARVLTRIGFGDTHPNYLPVEFSLDNKFFKSKNDSHTPIAIDTLIKRLSDEMLYGIQTKSGYHFPTTIQNTIKGTELTWINPIETLMREVAALYFSDSPMISSFEDQVAFTLLSYAHILLFLCQNEQLNIQDLEILCKDCIDRGVVMITILKLHLLNISGHLTSDNLKSVLIHTVMPAWIVKKQPIILSRRRFIDYTCKRMAKAPEPNSGSLASSLVKLPKETSGYLPAPSQFQSVFPECSKAWSDEMYFDYLNHSFDIPLTLFTGNIMDTVAETTRKENPGSYQFTLIENVNKLPYIVTIKNQNLNQPYYENLNKLLFAEQIAIPDITKIACLLQSPILAKTTKLLQNMFNNPSLGFTLALCNPQPTVVKLSVDNSVVHIQFTAYFDLSQNNIKNQSLRANIVIDDHMKGAAYIVLSNSTL